MSLRRSAQVIRCAAAGVFFSFGFLTGVGAIPIAGTLAPAEALHLYGTVKTETVSASPLVAVWTPRDTSSPIRLPNQAFSVSVMDVTWLTEKGRSDAVRTENFATRGFNPISIHVASAKHAIVSPTLSVELKDREAKWILTPRDSGSMQVVLGPRSACQILPQAARPIDLTNDPSVAYPSRVWSGTDSPILSSHCKAASLLVSGADCVTMYGTDIRISGTSVRSGRGTNLHARTGHFVSGTPQADEHRLTTLEICSESGVADVTWPGGDDVWIQSSTAQVTGELRTPHGDGVLSWDNQTFTNPSSTLAPQGTFTVRGRSESQLEIRGESSNSLKPVAVRMSVLAVAIALSRRALLCAQFFFTRLVRDRTLDHPRRRAILDAVVAHPGIQIEDLAQLLGFNHQSAKYHASVLCKQGILICRHFGRHTALYTKEASSTTDEARAFILRKPFVQPILDALKERPGISQAEIRPKTGLSQSRVSKILAQLVELNVVRAVKQGTRVSYWPLER